MNDIPLKDDIECKQQINSVPTSSQEEIEKLAGDLADSYIKYITVDTADPEQRFNDALEECLTHLEEVCSVLDSFSDTSPAISSFVEKLASKDKSNVALYEQIDAMEQYIFDANQYLDQLDTLMKDLESHRGSSSSRIRRIIHLIPRLSLTGMPRLLDSFGGLIEDDSRNVETESSIAPISEILSQVSTLEIKFMEANSCLLEKIYKHGDRGYAKNQADEELAHNPSAGEIDSSWQELL